MKNGGVTVTRKLPTSTQCLAPRSAYILFLNLLTFYHEDSMAIVLYNIQSIRQVINNHTAFLRTPKLTLTSHNLMDAMPKQEVAI